jgi:hypothetical protein
MNTQPPNHYQTIYNIISDIDPMGIADSAPDEYDPEVLRVLNFIASYPHPLTHEALTQAIHLIFDFCFSVPTQVKLKTYEQISEQILTQLSQEQLQNNFKEFLDPDFDFQKIQEEVIEKRKEKDLRQKEIEDAKVDETGLRIEHNGFVVLFWEDIIEDANERSLDLNDIARTVVRYYEEMKKENMRKKIRAYVGGYRILAFVNNHNNIRVQMIN